MHVSDYFIFPSDKTLFPCFLHHPLPSNPISHQLSRRECFYLLVVVQPRGATNRVRKACGVSLWGISQGLSEISLGLSWISLGLSGLSLGLSGVSLSGVSLRCHQGCAVLVSSLGSGAPSHLKLAHFNQFDVPNVTYLLRSLVLHGSKSCIFLTNCSLCLQTSSSFGTKVYVVKAT